MEKLKCECGHGKFEVADNHLFCERCGLCRGIFDATNSDYRGQQTRKYAFRTMARNIVDAAKKSNLFSAPVVIDDSAFSASCREVFANHVSRNRKQGRRHK